MPGPVVVGEPIEEDVGDFDIARFLEVEVHEFLALLEDRRFAFGGENGVDGVADVLGD